LLLMKTGGTIRTYRQSEGCETTQERVGVSPPVSSNQHAQNRGEPTPPRSTHF
jgi:hypothetical protein